MNIKFIKLISSDEIVGDVSEYKDRIVVRTPISLIPSPNGIAMIPFPMIKLEDKEITIDKTNIIFISTPNIDMINAYNSRFGSGIVVPTKIVDV